MNDLLKDEDIWGAATAPESPTLSDADIWGGSASTPQQPTAELSDADIWGGGENPSQVADRKIINGREYRLGKDSGVVFDDKNKIVDDPAIQQAFGIKVPEDNSSALTDLQAGWESLKGIFATNRLVQSQQDVEASSGPIHTTRGPARPASPLEKAQRLKAAREAETQALSDMGAAQAAGAKLPKSPAGEKFVNAKTFGEAWDAFASDPYSVTRSTMLQSLPASMPSIVGGIAGSILGPAGSAAGAGYGSYMTELGGAVQEGLQHYGADLSNPQSVLDTWAKHKDEISKFAQTRAGIVGTADALTAGLSSKIGATAPAKQWIKGEIKREILGTAVEAGGGMGGEAAAQLATTGEIAPGQMLAEGLGEIPGGAIQVAGQTAVHSLAGNRDDRAPSAPPPPAAPGGQRIEPTLFPGGAPQGQQAAPPPGSPPGAPPAEAPISDDAWLMGAGYTPEQIDDMNPEERASAAEEARAQGVEPVDLMAGAPAPGAAPMAPRGTRRDRVNVQSEQDLEAVRPTVNAEPSEAQAAAGNYQLGHVKIHGLDVSIETPKGAVRKGKDADGETWQSPPMPGDYGYFKRTEGRDGDKLDVYIGPDPVSPRVFIVEQHDLKTGKFDELKIVMGARSLDEAVSLYAGSFDNPSLDRIGDVTEMPVEQFKDWLKQGNGKRPVAKSIKNARQRDARTQQDAGTYDLAANQAAVSQPAEQALSPVRGAGNYNSPGMGGGFSGVSEGRRPAPGEGYDAGPDQQRLGVSAGQYAVDRLENSVGQPALSGDGRVQGRDDDSRRGIAPSGNEASNGGPSSAQRSADGTGADAGANSSLAGPGEGRSGPVSVAADDFDSIFQQELDAEYGAPAPAAAPQVSPEVERALDGFIKGRKPLTPEAFASHAGISPEEAGRGLQHALGKGWITQSRNGTLRRQPVRSSPINVLDFIASIGGMSDPTGELAGMDLPKMGPFGPPVRKNGLHPDKVREALVERGYLTDRGRDMGGQGETTVADVYDLIARHMGGQRAYAPEDQAKADDLETTRAAEAQNPDLEGVHPIALRWGEGIWNVVQDFLAENGSYEEAWSPGEINDVARMVNQGMNVDDAFERAALMHVDDLLDIPDLAPEITAAFERTRQTDMLDLPPFPDVEPTNVAQQPETPADSEAVRASGEGSGRPAGEAEAGSGSAQVRDAGESRPEAGSAEPNARQDFRGEFDGVSNSDFIADIESRIAAGENDVYIAPTNDGPEFRTALESRGWKMGRFGKKGKAFYSPARDGYLFYDAAVAGNRLNVQFSPLKAGDMADYPDFVTDPSPAGTMPEAADDNGVIEDAAPITTVSEKAGSAKFSINVVQDESGKFSASYDYELQGQSGGASPAFTGDAWLHDTPEAAIAKAASSMLRQFEYDFRDRNLPESKKRDVKKIILKLKEIGGVSNDEAPAAEKGADAKDQLVIPGAERDQKGALNNAAKAPLKASAPQKGMDVGLFGSERDQTDMFDTPAPKKAEAKADTGLAQQIRDKFVIFSSGMSRFKDFLSGAYTTGTLSTRGIGVDVQELSDNQIKPMAKKIVEWQTQVFIDSGAFGVFKRNLKERVKYENALIDLFEKEGAEAPELEEISDAQLLTRYDQIANALSAASSLEGEADYPQPLYVAPDIVGDQAGSIALVKKHAKWINLRLDGGRQIIVPIQKGEKNLAEAFEAVAEILGRRDFIVGVPSNAKAVTDAEFAAFVKAAKPPKLHFLGTTDPAKIEPRIEAIAAAGYVPDHVSSDANMLRALLYGRSDIEETRDEGIRRVIKDKSPEFGELAGAEPDEFFKDEYLEEQGRTESFDDVFGEELDAEFGEKPQKANLQGNWWEPLMGGEEKPKKKPKTAGEAAKSAAKNTAQGMGEIVQGLEALFGSKNKLSSGFTFDEESYAKALPLFKAAVTHLGEAVSDMREVVRALIKKFREEGMSRDALEGMAPYLKRFAEDVTAGKISLEAEAPKAEEGNFHPLVVAFVDYLTQPDAAFDTITEARKFAKDRGFDAKPGTPEAKDLDEKLELAIVLTARTLVGASKKRPPVTAYRRLVDLYNRQPNLGVRTSESMADQAYSTPAPLAFIASRLAGVAGAKSVMEPTAGNGMLLIEASPSKADVNELNDRRREALKAQGFRASGKDAATENLRHKGYPVEAIIANPPFGAVRDTDGGSKTFTVDGWNTTQIDHAIALNTLKSLADTGRAVLIVGSVKEGTDKTRSDAYNTKQKREFYWRLYQGYNVVDHFTVAGDLYKRQGAGWPVDVIVIEGRGKSARPLPAVELPKFYDTWEALEEKLNEAPAQTDTGTGQEAGGAAVSGPAGRRDGAEDGAGLAPRGQRDHAAAGERGTGGGDVDLFGQARIPDDRNLGEPAGLGEQQSREPDGGEVSPGTRDERDGDRQPAAAPRERVKQEAGAAQQTYKPMSGLKALDTNIPTNMADAVEQSLKTLAEEHGDLDRWIEKELGYKKGELGNYLAAEQVDAVALAIHNVKKNAAFIIGDQTGIGKGRVVASALRYAMRNRLVPIFVTEKPNLYGDIIRDLNDIGVPQMLGRDLKPFLTNAGASIPLDDEAVAWYDEAERAKVAGNPAPEKRGKFLRASGGDLHKRQMAALQKDGTGKDFDIIFTTYDQLNTVKGQPTDRRRLVEGLADRSFMVLDESHNAGGTEASERAAKDAPESRSDFLKKMTGKAKAVMFSSATYAKRPGVMALYARTDMGKAVEKPEMLGALIERGGVPMQQVVAAMLAKAGQYIRRERSFDGVSYDVEPVTVDLKAYEAVSTSLSAIAQFDMALKKGDTFKEIKENLKESAEAAAMDSGTGSASVSSTNFTSLMHNIVNQMLLAIKTDAVASRAIEALKAGEKPVITVANTMGAFLKTYAEENDLKRGDAVDLSFRDVLSRYLERTRRLTIKRPDNTTYHYMIPLSALPGDLLSAYREAERLIGTIDTANLPISPIDWLRHRIQKAGYRVSEITGRKEILEYGGPDNATFAQRLDSEVSPAGRRVNIDKFNRGDLDVMILNRAGSTGLSLHASSKFKDQRRRRMIIAQAELNIDVHMQMLGRVHRTGQVIPPAFVQAYADVPAEARPAAVLAKKMASLNANTTASRKSAFSADDSVDFLNEYGDQIAREYLAENPGINELLDVSLDPEKETARELTGRLLLLPVAQQRAALDDITARYKVLIENLDAMGENALEAKTIDLEAKTVNRQDLKPAEGDSPFTQAVVLEQTEVKSQGKALPLSEIIERAAEALGAGKVSTENPESALNELERVGRASKAAHYKKWYDDFDRMAADEIKVTKNEDLKTKRREALNENRYRFTRITDLLMAGRRVVVKAKDGSPLTGIVMKVSRRGQTGVTGNPLALGAWSAEIAIPDNAQRITVPFSSLALPGDTVGEAERKVFVEEPDWANGVKQTVEAFENARKTGKETRYIVTGNILAGFDQTKGQGQIINYTDDQGNVKPGILMSKTFSPKAFLESRAVRFKTAAQVLAFLDKLPDAEIMSHDDIITVRKTGAWVEVEMPAARQSGGTYFLNPDVRKAASDQFTKVGSRMRYKTNLPESASRVLDAMMTAGAVFQTTDQQDAAEEIITGKKPEARKQAPLSSRRQAPLSSRSAQSTFASEFMAELAQVDDLFQFPRSRATTIERVIAETAPQMKPMGRFMLSESDQQNGVVSKKRFADEDGHQFFIMEDGDGQVWIDISDHKAGLGGSSVYAAVANYAYNTRKVFIGDPVGLSDKALRRRTEAMLSTALKFGTTRHIEPHPRQLKGAPEIGIPPLKWTHGNDADNVASLIEASTANLINAEPDIANARYDFSSRTFRDAQGEPASDEVLAGWASESRRVRKTGAGRNTLKRAILLNTLLRGESSARPRLLEHALRFSRALVDQGGLKGLLYSKAKPTFYSGLLKAVEGMKQDTAPKAQWMGQIRNTPGIKAEEIAWIGLEGWLAEQSGQITKKQLTDFIKANQVEVQEVVKERKTVSSYRSANDYRDELWELSDQALGDAYAMEFGFDPEDARQQAIDDRDTVMDELVEAYEQSLGGRGADDRGETTFDTTKFSKYQLPGGENYREILLTLPEKDAIKISGTIMVYADTDADGILTDISAEGLEGLDYGRETDPAGHEQIYFADLNPDDLAKFEEITTRNGGHLVVDKKQGSKATYRSSHFDEPNILAHVRFNERMVDGKRVLFIEEIQSDWHQTGRKQGYGPKLSNDDVVALVDERDGLSRVTAPRSFRREEMTAAELQQKLDRIEEITRQLARSNGVPDAPFKTSWPELAMKRMIRWAAENGFDRIAWTPGEVQAERYDLSRQVSSIRWSPSENFAGQTYVSIDMRNGGTLGFPINDKGQVTQVSSLSTFADQFRGKTIDDVVGKEIGEKIRNSAQGELKGDGLNVGGAGMRAFYDKILVDVANKLGKKWGAKVGQTTINVAGGKPTQYADFSAYERAVKGFGNVVPSLDIPAEMKAAAMEGQPLFKRQKPEDTTRRPENPYRFVISAKQQAQITREITQIAERILGHRLARVEIVTNQAEWDETFSPEEDAVYDPNTGIIYLALHGSQDLRSTLRHEAVHALRQAGVITAQEWAVLSRMSQTRWIEQYGIRDRYEEFYRERFDITEAELEQILIEEAIADAMADSWGKAPAEDVVSRIFARIKAFLEAVRNALRGQGFTTASQIITGIEQGSMARRRPGTGQGRDILLYARQSEQAPLSSRRRLSPPQNPTPGSFEAPHDERVLRALTDSTDSLLSRLKRAGRAFGTEFRRKAQDREIDLLRTQNAIEQANGGPLAEPRNAYLAASLYPGRVAQRDKDLVDDVIEPLVKDIARRGLSLEEVNDFVMARHAIERNLEVGQLHKPGSQFHEAMTNPAIVGGSGMSENEATDILNEALNSGKLADLEAIGDQIVDMNRRTLDKLYAEGLITQEQYDALTTKYQYYVPLRGWDDVTSEEHPEGPRTGRRYDVRGKEFQQAFGRTSKADSPLAYSIMQARQALIRIEKNRVGKRFLRLAQANPNEAFWQVNRVDLKKVVDKDTGLVRNVFDRGATEAENVYAVKVGGKRYNITLHHEGLLRAMKGIGGENMGDLVGVFHKINRFFAMMNTQLDPEFIFRNFLRDVQQAGIVLQEEQTRGITRKVIASIPKAAHGMNQMLAGNLNSQWARYAREFADAGGKIGFMDRADVDTEKANLQKLMKQANAGMTRKTVMKANELTLERLSRWNDSIENTLRLATYVALRQAGATKDRAAFVARELTVNFNRKGEWGPQLNAFYLFFNASMQGAASLFMRFGRSRKIRMVAAGLIVEAFLMDMLNRMIGGDDDDDKNRYDKIPIEERSRNHIFMMPKWVEDQYGVPYFKVPLPLGWNWFNIIGQQASQAVAGAVTPLEAFGNVAGSFVDSFNPLGSASLLNTLVPTIADPVADIASNKDFFGEDIVPRQFDETTPYAERYKPNVSPYAKWITDSLSSLTGGSPERPGSIDWSPEWVEHLADFTFGGLGRFFTRSMSVGDAWVKGEELDATKTPFKRVFVGRDSTYADRDEYFQIRDAVHITEKELRARIAEKNPEAAAAVRRDHARELKMMNLLDAAEKQLTKLRKDYKAIKGSLKMGEASRAKRLEAITQRMDEIQRKVRTRWNQLGEDVETGTSSGAR